MKQEFDFQNSHKESQLIIGTVLVLIIPFFILISFPSLRYMHMKNSFYIICEIACVLSVLEGLFLIHKANNTHLILSEIGIEYKTPIMVINVPWRKARLIEVRYRSGRKYSIVSSEMKVMRTKFGKLSPSNLEKLMPEIGFPISDFLGDNMDKILEILSAYPEFQNKP